MPSLKMLVADDNSINQRLLVGLLKVLGHTGVVVDDGDKVLRCLAQQNFDLILLDVQMPVMDGLQALQQIRKDEELGLRTTRMPVIMVTANDFPGDRERFLERGADGYIAKPVKTEALQQEISRVLRLF
jgi:CheY-like chemotaxis protein